MFPRQEKNFMKDPATANSRIYVGNLDISVTEEDLQTLFSPYGKILGISVQRNFGFIQFENEQCAALAIQKQLGCMLKGKKLNVRGAVTGEGGKGNHPKNQLSANPPDSGDNEHSNNTPGGYPRRPRGGMAPRGGRGGGANTPMRGGFRDRSPLNRNDNFGYNRDEKFQSNFNREPFTANVAPPAAAPPVTPRRKADCNDCEIIVVAKSLTEYAEYIEQKLKNLGLTVDLLFPNEDVPIGRVLANIASRGCLYAILVTPQNEEHGSLTLNILHGLPQEHRNMPTEDAIQLVSRNFEAYMRGDKHIPGSVTMGLLAERHPEAIQVLLNLLAENRQLTVLQYDRIIKYLQERRELQLKHELGDAADELDTPSSVSSTSKAAELQNRILSILNSTAPSNTTGTGPATPTSNAATASAIAQILPSLASSVSKLSSTNSTTSNTNTSTTSAPLLNDPSVQKALDSLLQADLLKNIVKPSQTTPTNTSNNENYGTNYSANVRRF